MQVVIIRVTAFRMSFKVPIAYNLNAVSGFSYLEKKDPQVFLDLGGGYQVLLIRLTVTSGDVCLQRHNLF